MDKQKVRRRLLRGTLSAPLVMTVSSAAGRARTTFTACLNNSSSQPRPWNVLSSESRSYDEWLRVNLEIYRVQLTRADGSVAEVPGQYFVGTDRSTMFRLAATSPESTPPTQVTEFNANTLGLQRYTVDRRYALAYVNDDGRVVGYGWQSNGGQYTTKSCYTSVIAQDLRPRRRWWS